MKKMYGFLTSLIVFVLGGISVFSCLSFGKINMAKAIFDYSKDDDFTSLNISEVVSKVLDEEINEVEATYLDESFSNYSLNYQNLPVDLNYQAVDYYSDLYVTAESFDFVDKNNRKLSYIPSSASYNGMTKPFFKDKDQYKVTFENYDNGNKNVEIQYELKLILSNTEINKVLNSAYTKAKEIETKLDSNVTLKDQYDEEMLAYNQYLLDLANYEKQVKDYEEYLKLKAQYDVNLANYNQYLISEKKYEEDLANYNNYLQALEEYNAQVEAYAKYLKDLDFYNSNYEANKELYDSYLSSKSKIEYRLTAMSQMYEEMTDYNRTLEAAIVGDSVTSVLSRKDDIVSVGGVSSEAVDRASIATSELREVFKSYNELETDKDRYEYYRLNWSHIRDNINDLARCLDKFLHNDTVFNFLASQDGNKLEKYYILVAQLIYFADILNVSPVYNFDGWNYTSGIGTLNKPGAAYLNGSYPIRVSKNKTLTYKEILGEINYLDPSLKYARPGPEKYDSDLIELMTEPKEVAKPGAKPEPVKEPVKPKTVPNPGEAPSVIEKPGEKPSEVKIPANPQYFEISNDEISLYNAYKNGEIENRTLFNHDVEILISESRNLDFTNSLKHLVKLYDTENNYLGEKIISKGLDVSSFDVPTYGQDVPYNNYSFIWVLENDQEIDILTLEQSCNLKAVFVPGSLKEFEISWDIDGLITKETYKYGETLVAPTNVNKADNNGCYYEFIGWNQTLGIVTKDQTIRAIFSEKHYIYIDKYVEGVLTKYTFKEGMVDTNFDEPYKDETDQNYYEFKEWKITTLDKYHSKYEAIFTEYKFIYITWIVNDNLTILNQKFKETDEISYNFADPTLPGDEVYALYILDYWADSQGNKVNLSKVNSSMTLTAHYKGSSQIRYHVSFYVDNKLISSRTYVYGATPFIPTAIKKDDENHYYVFKSWDKEIVNVTGNAEYHAIFEAKNFIEVEINVNNEISLQKVKQISDLVLNNPAKPEQNGYFYAFSHWDISSIDEFHFIYKAIFDEYFRVTFVVENNMTTVSFKTGTTVTYLTPTKESNEVYFYTFLSWLDASGEEVNLEDINSSTILYSSFKENYVEYTITWVLGNDTYEEHYRYGEAISIPSNLEKEETELTYYVFNGFDHRVNSFVYQNDTYIAQYKTYNFIFVTTSIDGTLTNYKFNTLEEINIPDPIKENDEKHEYNFLKWNISNVGSSYSYIYVAEFEVTNFYFVSWYSQEILLKTERYKEGERISYKGEISNLDLDERHYLEFYGWSVNLSSYRIQSDIRVDALFRTANKISVTWFTNQGSYIDFYMPGDKVGLPNISLESYFDSTYYYEFSSWDKSLVNYIETELIYNAIYARHALLTNGETIISITENNGVLQGLLGNSNFETVDFTYLFKSLDLRNDSYSIEINSSNLRLNLSNPRVQYLRLQGINTLSFNMKKNEFNRLTFSLDAYKNNDEKVQPGTLNFELEIHSDFSKGTSYLYLENERIDAIFSDSSLNINLVENSLVYEIKTTYFIDYEYSLNYSLELAKTSAEEGEEIEFVITPSTGYRIKKITLESEGTKALIEGTSFVMPKGNVVLNVEAEKILYTIQFIINGKVVAIKQGYYGDILLDPGFSNPDIYEIPNDEEYRYVFIDWDKEISEITGDEIYTAIIEKIPLVHNQIQQKTSILLILLLSVSGITILSISAVVIFNIIKRKKQKTI